MDASSHLIVATTLEAMRATRKMSVTTSTRLPRRFLADDMATSCPYDIRQGPSIITIDTVLLTL